MNTRIITGIVLVSALLQACIPSIHALYTVETLVYQAGLIGTWEEPGDGGETWIFEKRQGKLYTLTHIDNNGRKGNFEVGMVELNGLLFLDFYPIDTKPEATDCELNDMLNFHLYPMHTFARIELTDQALSIHMLGSEWLHQMFRERKIRIDFEVEGDDDFVLTASTSELQKFFTKYGHESRAYVDAIELSKKE